MRHLITVGIILCLVTVPTLIVVAKSPSVVVATPDQADLKWVSCGRDMPAGCEVAVLHGNPKSGPSELYVRMPQGYRFPAHWHTANERITVVQGNPSFVAQDGETINAKPGTFLFLPGKTAHSGQCGDTEACVLSISLDKPLDIHAGDAKP